MLGLAEKIIQLLSKSRIKYYSVRVHPAFLAFGTLISDWPSGQFIFYFQNDHTSFSPRNMSLTKKVTRDSDEILPFHN